MARHTKGEIKVETVEQVEQTLDRDPVQLITDLIFLVITLLLIPVRNMLFTFFARPKSLKGKVCIVTGSGRGLGREICLALAKEGAILACAEFNEENNKQTVEMVVQLNAAAKAYTVNVANKDEVEELVAQVEEELGPVYMLVNNAGIILPCSEPSEEYVRALFNVNILGAMWMTGAVLPLMKKRNHGHIVNISSISALYGTPVLAAYAASKAALSNYSQSLRLELSYNTKNRIHVTCIHPDVVNTNTYYFEMLTRRIGAQNVADVIKDIMYAIKYNQTDVSSPFYYYYLTSLIAFLPSEVVHKFIKLMDVALHMPSQEEWNELPVASIVKSSTSLKARDRHSKDAIQLLAAGDSEDARLLSDLCHTKKSRNIVFNRPKSHHHSHESDKAKTSVESPLSDSESKTDDKKIVEEGDATKAVEVAGQTEMPKEMVKEEDGPRVTS